MTKQTNTPSKPSPMTKGQAVDITEDEVAGNDLKKARGLDKEAGKSPNEAGTDQRVEDAKKSRKSGH